jgi:hypothetical protein
MSDLPPPPPPGNSGDGYQQQGYGYGYGPQAQKTNGLAIASLVCGIVGLLLFGIILGPLAFIFGLVAMNQINKSGGAQKGKGLAIAGVVFGAIALVGAIIFASIILGE